MKVNFVISEASNERLNEISKRYGLSKSDILRRGVDMLHDYLIKNIEHPECHLGALPTDEVKNE